MKNSSRTPDREQSENIKVKRFVPDENNTVQDLPLYLRVALWALHEGRPVSRADIARQFLITPRSAADLMLYIDGPGQRLVEAERLVLQDGSGRGKAVLSVTMVNVGQCKRVGTGRPVGSGRRRPAYNQPSYPELRDLALGRRPLGRQS